jgi:hypothetical protein
MYGGRDHVTASPRPPLPRDPVERDDPEALIEEARQRARRRRRLYGAAAALLALLGIVLFASLGRPEPSQSAAADPAALPVATDDEAATLVAHWGEIHVGYVLVYGDGRVIVYPDLHAVIPGPFDWSAEWNPGFEGLLERRLTADGLDLVRSGAVQPSAFLPDERVVGAAGTESKTSLPAGTWADPGFTPYVASRYAICDWERGASAEAALGRFPASVRPLLRGKEQTYTNPGLFMAPELAPRECFEVSAEESRFLEALDLVVVPVLPHGDYVAWGG